MVDAKGILKDDPRRIYFRLLHILSIVVPNNAEKIIDEFQIPEGLPEETRRLTLDAIDLSLARLKRIEMRLERLRNFLLSGSGGERR